MPYQFYVRHLDRNGVNKNAQVTDYIRLDYRRVVNAPGFFSWRLPLPHRVIDTIAKFDLLEVYMKNDTLGIPWHLEYEVIATGVTYQTDENNLTDVVVRGRGQAHILGYRQIAWASGVNDRSSFATVPAETLAKTIVDYNCTSLATVANGRLREGDLAPGMGFTIVTAPDLGNGNSISLSFSNGNLLRILADKIPSLAGGDWSFVRTPSGGVEARWVFDFHLGQLGEDKTSGSKMVEFSIERGNMLNPAYADIWETEATVSITGGNGQLENRYYQEDTGVDYSTSNDLEMYVDARNTYGLSLSSFADYRLDERRRQRALVFDTIQTDAVFYSPVAVSGKKTYTLGDRVAVSYSPASYIAERKITAISVSHAPESSSEETRIDVEFETYD